MEKEIRDKIFYLLSDLEKDCPLPDENFNETLKSFDFKLPHEYLEVMKAFNGGEGHVGHGRWLILFPFNEVKEINDDYKLLMNEIPDYFLIGKDAADTGFAFHKTNGSFHSFGLMSNFKTDPIEFLGNDFVEFLEYLDSYKFEG